MSLMGGRSVFIIILFVLVITISCQVRVEGRTRMLQEDFANTGNSYSLSKYPLSDWTKHRMAYLLERLASGPSDGGGGN